MGQYYSPCILDANGTITATMYSWDYGYGLKLMEHSWLDSGFVRAFEALLALDGARRVVWAGDYAEPEPGTVTEENEYGLNLYTISDAEHLRVIFDTEDFRRDQRKAHATKVDPAKVRPLPVKVGTRSHPFICNHDKLEYVNKNRVPKITAKWAEGRTYRIHPLPLLTAEGNGQGGGDFFGKDAQGLVGRWARDRISVSPNRPEGEHWTEVKFDLIEE